MTINQSPFAVIKQLQADILRLLRAIDVTDYSLAEQKSIAVLKNTLADVRLDIQDYEFAETKADQERFSKDAKKRLAETHVLLLSLPAGIAGPVDIAHLSAYISDIIDRLR